MSLNREAPLKATAGFPSIFSALALAAGIALGATASLFLKQAQSKTKPIDSAPPRINDQLPAPPYGELPVMAADSGSPSAAIAALALPALSEEQAVLAWHGLRLTCAETRIALRIVRGYSFSSIAEELGTSNQSVRKAASRIYHKAGVATRADFTAQLAVVSPAGQLESATSQEHSAPWADGTLVESHCTSNMGK